MYSLLSRLACPVGGVGGLLPKCYPSVSKVFPGEDKRLVFTLVA